MLCRASLPAWVTPSCTATAAVDLIGTRVRFISGLRTTKTMMVPPCAAVLDQAAGSQLCSALQRFAHALQHLP